MEQTLLLWITQYGHAAIFGLLVFGIVGLPIPDETLLTLAGALVRRGELHFLPTLVAAAGGAMTGITVSYAIGRYVGLPVLHRFGRYVHLSDGQLHRVNDWFRRRGRWTLMFGYFVPGVRHLIAIVAGSSELELPVFALFAYSGAILWTVAFLSLGYYLGDQWAPAVHAVRRHVVMTAVVLGVLALAYLVFRRRRRR